MLVAFLIYNDGINTIIRMASIYGAQVGIAVRAPDLRAAAGAVRRHPVRLRLRRGSPAGSARSVSVFIALAVYVVISVLGYFMTTALDFYLLAFLVGTVQGGSQALSRSMFASMIPKQKSSEFFAFFAVFEKFAGIIGPAIFAYTIGTTGSSRNAILSVIVFFVVGAVAARDGERARGPARGARGGDALPGRRPRAAAHELPPTTWSGAVARLAVWLFYRVERVGHDLPAGPVLVVANHPNGLLDPPMIVATAGRAPRFLAKSTLFAHAAGRLVRSRRGRDPRLPAGPTRAWTPSRNNEMFAAVERALVDGDVGVPLPRGHDALARPARPAEDGRGAHRARRCRPAASRCRSSPSGLNLDRKAILRSGATVAYGHPLRLRPPLDLYRPTRSPPSRAHRGRSPPTSATSWSRPSPLDEADLVRRSTGSTWPRVDVQDPRRPAGAASAARRARAPGAARAAAGGARRPGRDGRRYDRRLARFGVRESGRRRRVAGRGRAASPCANRCGSVALGPLVVGASRRSSSRTR